MANSKHRVNIYISFTYEAEWEGVKEKVINNVQPFFSRFVCAVGTNHSRKDCVKMMDKHIPQEFRVTERGVRGPAKHCPHNIIFPAMVSALKTFMGLPPRTHDSIAHGIKWRDR